MVKLLQGQCIEDDAPSLDNTITLFNLAISIIAAITTGMPAIVIPVSLE